MIQQIVANNFVLKNFSNIDIFKRELGNNLTGAVSNKGKDRSNLQIKISDDFVHRYRNNTKNLIFRYGSIGSLVFYQDTKLENNEFIAFDGDKIYEIEIESIEEFKNNPRKYLSNLLDKIENGEKEENGENYMLFSTVPNGVEIPDITLPKDQYLDKMVKRRKKLS